MPGERDPASEPTVDLVPATGSGGEWIHTLLASATLPTADLGAGRCEDAGDAIQNDDADATGQSSESDGPARYVVRADAGRVGCIGIERYGDASLLRSAATQGATAGVQSVHSKQRPAKPGPSASTC